MPQQFCFSSQLFANLAFGTALLAAVPCSAQSTGTCAGDLSGTYPNCTVSKVNGQTPGSATYQNASSFSLTGGYQSNTLPVGSSGVLVNQIVVVDNGGNAVLPPSSSLYSGIAASSQTSGATVEVITGGITACAFDGPAIIGDIAVPSTTSLGYCHDSGQGSGSQIALGTPIIGILLTAASNSAPGAQVLLFGTGVTGTANPLPNAPAAGYVPVSTGPGTAYTAQTLSAAGGSGAVSSVNGQTGAVTLTAATVGADAAGASQIANAVTVNGQTPGTATYQNASSFSLTGGYQSNTMPVGPSGVLFNQIVALNAGGNAVLPTSSSLYSGLAASSKASGANVEVVTGGIAGCIFDGPAIVGNIAVPSTTSLGYCHDSGQNSGRQVALGTPIIGTLLTAASSSAPGARVLLFGTGVTGTANPLPNAPAAGYVPVSTGPGTAYTAQSLSAAGGSGGVSSINGQTGAITLTAANVGADAAGAAQTANAVTVNGAALPTSTANIYWNAAGQPTALLPISGVSIFGDSYFAGWGASSATTGLSALLQKDTPGPVVNYAVGGTTEGSIADEVIQNFVPSPYHLNVVLLNGGANDGTADTCSNSTTSICALDYSQLLNAAIASAGIPYGNRIMASKATVSGTWTAVAGLYAIQTNASPGTPMSSSTSGASLSFSVPSSAATKVGLTYTVSNAATGTFTVSVDGVSVLNACTGTATFSAAPCNPVGLLPGSQTVTSSIVRQEFAVTANIAHTIVVKLSTAAALTFNAVDYEVPGAAAAGGNNLVYVMGPNGTFRYASTYDTLTKNVVALLKGDGLPVFFMDQQSTTSPGPGVNTTSDISSTATAACPAATRSGHPNDCGYTHMLQTVENEETVSGYVFAAPNAGSSAAAASSGQVSGPINIQTPSDNYLNANEMLTYSSAAPINNTTSHNGAGFWFLREGTPGNNSGSDWAGFSAGKDTSSGLYPFSSRYMTRSVHTNAAAWDCASYLTITAATATASASFGESNYSYTNCRRNNDGAGWQKGIQAYAEGTPLASAATITPTSEIVHVTGTAAITTITVPSAMAGTSNSGGCITLIADGAWSTTTAGNIYAALTASPGIPYMACYTNSTAKWYLK